ncbi:MAG: signal peptidase I [Chloroflexota bacterium]
MNERQSSEPGSALRAVSDLLWTLVEAFALFVLLSLVIGRFEVRQVSMEPNFHEGQRVIVSKMETLWPRLVSVAEAASDHEPEPVSLQRGQVVVFYKSADHVGDPLIKRVIGLPGETVEIKDGSVLIDGAPLNEPYVGNLPTPCMGSCGPVTLAPNTFFMMGDNRPNSLDSRSFGPVPGEQIIGHVVLRYWPFSQIALFP